MTSLQQDPDQNGQQAGVASLFGSRNFRRLWLTGACAGSMRWLEILAVSVYAFEVSGSALTVALLMTARTAPMLLGAPIGALADRFDRKSILMAGLATMAASACVLGLLTVSGKLELWHIAIGAFLNGMFFASEFPVRRTMLAETAGPSQVGVALTLEAATNSATRMIGPILGGLLVELIGLQGAFFLSTALYGIAFVLVSGVDYRPAAAATGASLLMSIGEGLRYIRTDRKVVSFLLVTVIINLFGFPFATMVPVIGKDVLDLSPLPVGILASAEGFGSFACALLLTRLARPAHYSRIYLVGSVIFVLMIIGFALSRHFSLSLAFLALAGMGSAGFAAMQGTLVYSATPAEVRSRVMGVLSMSIGAGPFGVLHLGLLASWLDAPWALIVIGLEGLLALALAAAIWPNLLRVFEPRE